ncbi:MAG TPA: alpha/beta fold hydrolase [Candidatus Binatia bacterium]|nr:alpha/beta fold hydrolase [Candidatus Binatia bacterium]
MCLLALFAAGAAAAEPVPGWLHGPGAAAERVAEPVFGGDLVLYRAGPRGAPAVVLVHGLGQNGARDWEAVVPALATDREVWALDLPGFGASARGNQLYSPENYARAIEAVLAPRLKQPFVLVGHSMGAAVSLAYADAYPARLSRLVLVDMAGVLQRSVYAGFLGRLGAEQVTGAYPADGAWVDRVIGGLLLRAESLPIDPELLLRAPPIRQKLLRGDPNAIAAAALVQQDFGAALRRLRTPTLLIWGVDDKVAPLRTGLVAQALVPQARLALIEQSGHAPQLQQPARFNALLRDELAGRTPGRAREAPAAAFAAQRVGACEDQDGQRFSGDYRAITLTRCRDVEIRDARVGRLVSIASEARLVNVELREGLTAADSALELTAGSVQGAPAITLDTSTLDAAGTRIMSPAEPVLNRGAEPVTLQLSVCEVLRAGSPSYVHQVVRIAPRQRW